MKRTLHRPLWFAARLFFVFALFLPTAGLAQKIDLQLSNVTVKEAVAALNQQENYSVVIQSEGIDMMRTVNVSVRNASIEEVLDRIFSGQQVAYTINGRNVSVVKAAATPPLKNTANEAIKGIVKDSAGLPVAGATVVVDKTLIGTTTATDGSFELTNVKLPAVLNISFIGYADASVNVATYNPLTVTLTEATTGIDEVVIVGYGQQKKVNVTGAVGVIDGKDLNNRPVTNAAAALQGADPSLLLTMGSGSIESKNYSVSIRGSVSLNSGDPLILVDGVEASLTQVNPNDIESVSVLKDASSASIYGAKASAGVVLITTKKGSADRLKVNYNGRYGVSWNTTSTDFITSGYDYVNFTNEFYNSYRGHNAWTYTDEQMAMLKERRYDTKENAARPWVVEDATGKYSNVYLGNYDWYGYFFKRERSETEHNISLSGGNEKVDYYVSGRYLYREGLFNGGAEDKYNGYSLRSKINAKVTKWLTYSGNVSFEASSYKYGGYWEQDGSEDLVSSGILWNVTQNISPTYVPFNPDGTINMVPGFMADATSPLGSGRAGVWMDDRNKNARKNNYWIVSNKLTFDLLPNKDLKLIADYTYRRRDRLGTYRSLPTANSYDNVNKRMYIGNGLTGGNFSNGSIYDFYQEDRLYYNGHVANVYFQYDHSWGDHNFAATVGGNFEDYRQSSLSVRQKGSLSENLSFINMAQGEIERAVEANSAYRTLGFFARVNYDYKGKYLFEVSGRYDGSSRFSPGHRWGFFPSASAGWRISEESFWKDSKINDVWNNAKIRFSYGSLGNQQVANYYYFDKISTSQMDYTFDGENKAGYASISAPITDGLTWETVITYNLGIDLGFFNNRLNLSADFYIRDTKDMLTTALTLPDVYGAASPKMNAADLRTKGYEITVGWHDTKLVAGKPFTYGISASLGDYKSTITKYNNPDKLISDHYVGQTLGEIWGYRVAGLFKTDEEAARYQAAINDKAVNNGVYNSAAPYNKLMAGDVRFIDKDNSGEINRGAGTVDDPGDMEIIGNSLPRYTYSFRGNINWMGIDFSVFFQGVGQIDWMPAATCAYFWNTYQFPRSSFIAKGFPEKTWTEDNRNAYFPRHRGYQASSTGALGVKTDRYLQNARYLRLKNITLGYTLPIKRGIDKLRVYVSGENLAYWSPLKKYCKTVDPEVAVTGASDDCLYPYSRTFSVGVDITF